MQNAPFAIFIIFACVWILMGTATVILLLKSDNQEIRLGQQGLIIGAFIVLPIAIALLYQVVRFWMGQA